ncbi:MAG: hypothetical protein R3B13_24070 [Polyangiaceae bacterium]
MGARDTRWLLATAVLLLSCNRGREGTPGPQPAPSAGPSAVPELESPAAVSPPTASAAPSAPAASAPAEAGHPAPVGGLWLACYSGFAPRTQPKLDVMRLGLLCGPQNGMTKLTDTKEADVTEGGKGREHAFEAQAGDCYRIFAVAEPSVEDLDIEVLSPSGRRVAFDSSDDRWPVVKPDGPFCVTEDGVHRARVQAQRGHGRYAVEIWRLR